MSKDKPALIVRNKTATRNYNLGESFQAGIVLEGWEVKSLRNGKVDIKDSYVTFKNNEAWLIGTKIDPPASLKNFDADPTRTRKLLLHKREISQLQKLKGEKGLTVVLTSIYWKENHIKVFSHHDRGLCFTQRKRHPSIVIIIHFVVVVR